QARALQQAWTDWRQAQAALDTARSDAAGQAARLEQLAADVAWLDELAPEPGEWPDLCARQSRLAHAQTLLAGAGQAIEALDGETGSAAQALPAAIPALPPPARRDTSPQGPCQTRA